MGSTHELHFCLLWEKLASVVLSPIHLVPDCNNVLQEAQYVCYGTHADQWGLKYPWEEN